MMLIKKKNRFTFFLEKNQRFGEFSNKSFRHFELWEAGTTKTSQEQRRSVRKTFLKGGEKNLNRAAQKKGCWD